MQGRGMLKGVPLFCMAGKWRNTQISLEMEEKTKNICKNA